jgi:hypothetical protein
MNVCGSCVYFGRCKWLIGAQAGDECDWLPSRYRKNEAPAADLSNDADAFIADTIELEDELFGA